MSEFGHIASNGKGLFIDSWGAGPFIIRDGKGAWHRFEDSARFGPYIVTLRRNEISSQQPGARSPFWKAHRIWVRQGRRLSDDGISCLWDQPKPTTVRKVAGRQYMVIENGDEDGEVIIVEE
jgi:hypothetical protein